MPLYQLGTDPEFEKCLPDTLIEEGGYSNDAHDPGGMTMRGVTQREYDRWRRALDMPTRWVKQISDDEIRTIYHDDYWLPDCPEMPIGLNLCLFDTNVNNGPHEAIVLLQRTLGIADDGFWGPETEHEVKSITPGEVVPLIKRFCSVRGAYYQSLRNFKFFGRDWMRRDLDIERRALIMAGRA